MDLAVANNLTDVIILLDKIQGRVGRDEKKTTTGLRKRL